MPDQIGGSEDEQAEAHAYNQVPGPPEFKAEEHYQCNCRNVLAHIAPVNLALKCSRTQSNLIDRHSNSLRWLTLPKFLHPAILRRFIAHLALLPEICISGLA